MLRQIVPDLVPVRLGFEIDVHDGPALRLFVQARDHKGDEAVACEEAVEEPRTTVPAEAPEATCPGVTSATISTIGPCNSFASTKSL